MERRLENGMVVYAPCEYESLNGTQRRIAEGVKDKDNNDSFFLAAAKRMAPLIPKNAMLIPVPDHTGCDNANTRLCAAIMGVLTNTITACILASTERKSVREIKRKNGEVRVEDLGIKLCLDFERPSKRPVVFIDNVIDSGVTMMAAQKALGRECIGVAYAMTNNNNLGTVNGADTNKQEKKMANNSKENKGMENGKMVNKNGKTVLVCGNCGAEIPLPEHEHYASGIALGQDSGLGRVVLPAKGGTGQQTASGGTASIGASCGNVDMNAMMQMMTMMMQMMSQNPETKDAMVQTIQQTFGVHVPSGGGSSATMPCDTVAHKEQVGEVQTPKVDVEQVKMKMRKMKNVWLEKGYHNHLYRQMFEDFGVKFVETDNGSEVQDNYTKHINELGYEYMWSQLQHIAEVMLAIEKKDPNEFAEMKRCFVDTLCFETVCKNWVDNLEKWMKRKCKIANGKRKSDGKRGKYYKTHIFAYHDKELDKGVFVDELDDLLNDDFRARLKFFEGARDCRGYLLAFLEFNKARRSVKFTTKVDTAFKDAFKLWGAWCVMKILIDYDGCEAYKGWDGIGEADIASPRTSSETMEMLEERFWRKNDDGSWACKGFQFFAMMKELIWYNDFDYEAKKAAYQKRHKR